ncbi:MAG: alkyl sulfatase dimerization domain-containing protein [Oceanicoccus sp.]
MKFSSPNTFRILLVTGLVMLVNACDNSPTEVNVTAEGSAGNSVPSGFTIAANKRVLETLPFSDMRDFEDANRGLVATADNLVISHMRTGETIWDMPAYDFIQGNAPPTVNPSLWRQAKLNNTAGLYQVKEGIWQLRNFDLSTLSIIRGETGWILVDPGVSTENATVALAFLKQHLLADLPITAIVFTHSHVDHFGGVLGYITQEQYQSGDVQIIAPAGFLEEAASENIVLGTAMARRASYQYGSVLSPGIYGAVDLGLGKAVPFGTATLVQPNTIVSESGETLLVDGVEFEFQIASGTEAPAELTFYLPELNAFCGAEVISRTMHNVYTLRGAKVRDALLWSQVIDGIRQNYGHSEVIFNSHHWPVWGKDRIEEYLENQRDIYKFIHDQTVRMVLSGMTPNEIANTIELPQSLGQHFSSRGYYGTLQHNAKAVYQFYMGWYDSNPANLHPLAEADSAPKYIEMMGGIEAVVSKAKSYFDNGEYQWVAELLNHAVFAEPNHDGAKALLAHTYDQMAYQAESGPWRSEYLSAAHELRHGITLEPMGLADAGGMIALAPTEEFLKSLAVRIDPEKAAGKDLLIELILPDVNEAYSLVLRNSVLNYYPRHNISYDDQEIDVSITLNKDVFLSILTRTANIKDLLLGNAVDVEGSRLDLISFFASVDSPDSVFAIVTP